MKLSEPCKRCSSCSSQYGRLLSRVLMMSIILETLPYTLPEGCCPGMMSIILETQDMACFLKAVVQA